MRLELTTYIQDRIRAQVAVELREAQADESFVQVLQAALIQGCRALNIGLPIWMDRNTREFARFRQTLFFEGQFIEAPAFDRLQVRLLPGGSE